MPFRWLLYSALIAAPALFWNGHFPLDDAYITMHNARSLLAGGDATYGVPALIGATSVVHLLLVAGLGLVLPMPWALLVVSLAGAVGYAAALDRLAAHLDGWKRPALVSAALAIGSVPSFLVNGLETSLAMATVAWLLVLRDDRRLCLLVGISPFVRPEIAVLGALLLARQLWSCGGRDRMTRAIVAAAVASPFIAWSFLQTGQLLPGTLAAKVAFFSEGATPLTARLAAPFRALVAYGLWPLLAGIVGQRLWPSLVFLGVVLGAGMALIPGAFDWNGGRYLAPLLPVLVMGLACKGWTVPIAFAAAWAAVLFPTQLAALNDLRAWYQAEGARLGRELGGLPRGTVVLVHDAGLAAWVAPHLRLVDVVGLKTPSSVAAHQALTPRACDWGAALDRIAAQSGAEYAIVLQRPYWRCVGENLASAGWQLQPIGTGEYQLFRITRN